MGSSQLSFLEHASVDRGRVVIQESHHSSVDSSKKQRPGLFNDTWLHVSDRDGV